MSEEASLDDFTADSSKLLTNESNGVRLTIDEEHPQDWKYANLDKTCKVKSGFSWSKEQETNSPQNDAIPVIKIGNVRDGYIDLTDILYLTGISEKEFHENKARKNWLLMIGSNGSEERVGHCGLVEKDLEFVYASFLYGLRTNSEYLLSRYLFYNLNRPKVQKRLTSFTAGSTSLKNLNKSTISNLSIPVAPLGEQRKITTILYTIDQAIQKTKEIKEQLIRTKAGLSQELFHKGVQGGETKNEWMGPVPIQWDVREFSDIIEISQNGIYKKGDEYAGDYPIIKMGDIFGGVTLDEPIKESVHLSDDEKTKYATRKGDLVFARHAQAGWGAGDCTYVPHTNETTVVESNMIQVRLNAEVKPLFYAQYFNSEVGIKSIKRITTTGNIKGISQSDLLNLSIPVPQKEEQKEIATILSVFDERIKHTDSEITRLRSLKQGLTQDLLSGTVRTDDVDIPVLDEILAHG